MTTRSSRAVWEGALRTGTGTCVLGGGAFEAPYSFGSRFESAGGSNPEELIAAAHAACFTMALAHQLGEAGHAPLRLEATASVHLDKGQGGYDIPRIDLEVEGDVPGVDDAEFARIAEIAKETCPVSKLLRAAEIGLTACLVPRRSAEATGAPARPR